MNINYIQEFHQYCSDYFNNFYSIELNYDNVGSIIQLTKSSLNERDLMLLYSIWLADKQYFSIYQELGLYQIFSDTSRLIMSLLEDDYYKQDEILNQIINVFNENYNVKELAKNGQELDVDLSEQIKSFFWQFRVDIKIKY